MTPPTCRRIAFTFLIVSALAFAGFSSTFAHEGATGVVKERMAAMKTMGRAVKSLAAMFRGKIAFDQAQARQDTNTIKLHSGDALLSLFPKGSHSKASEAATRIWEDLALFIEETNKLSRFSDDLLKAIDEGKPREDVNAVFRKLTKTCSSCHKTFRQKK